MPRPNDMPPYGTVPNQPRGSSVTAAPGVVSVSVLRVGMRLAQGLYDQSGVLLLAGGTTITPEFLQLLRQREIHWVTTGKPPSIPDAEGERAARISRLEQRFNPEYSTLAISPLDNNRRPRLPYPQLKMRARRGLFRHRAATSTVENVCDTLRSGEKTTPGEMHRIIYDFADMVALDLDLLPTILALKSNPDEYLYQHCVNTAVMSITIAFQLGLTREKIMEVGLGALLHDVGMLRVPESIRLAPRSLTQDEMDEVRRHPLYTIDYMEQIPGLPVEVRMVGYQVHERLNESGYPAGKSEQSVHAYAKIVSIADAYVAMTAPRPHRVALSPYEAARAILYECGEGQYDSEYVRAFLDSVSLIPIGSLVELDDGREARVVRANPGLHTRPVLQILDCDRQPVDDPIDLATVRDVKIVRAVDNESTV